MDDQTRERPGDDRHRHHLSDEGNPMTNTARPEVAAHLAEEAASPEELHELQATLALLSSLPQVAPRRTFILTPELVATNAPRTARRHAWVWPTRWATALAAVCFAATIGLDRGTPPAPTAIEPSPTTVVAAATATPSTTPRVQIFATVEFVIPVPTVVPVLPALVPAPPVAPRTDWRPAQIALGALTALGACFGFALPPFLRRRDDSAS